MSYIFTAKTEEEAVAKAVEELNIGSEMFDVEIIEEKKGFFKRSSVTIRVHLQQAAKTSKKEKKDRPKSPQRTDRQGSTPRRGAAKAKQQDNRDKRDNRDFSDAQDEADVPEAVSAEAVAFATQLLEHFGCPAEVTVLSRKKGKLVLSADGEELSRIIGKGGRTLDAIQTLVSSYTNTKNNLVRVIFDAGGYRMEQEERLIQRAFDAANRVQSTGRDYRFEPLNAHDRRLIHMALKDIVGIETESEGSGMEKKLRVYKAF